MSRPKSNRKTCCRPNCLVFKPKGICCNDLEAVQLEQEEFEAIKHRYLESMDQNSTALLLGTSQPTFHRILESANRKIADALVNGKTIIIKE